MRGRHLPKSVFHTEHSGAKKKGGRLPRFGSRVAEPQNPVKRVQRAYRVRRTPSLESHLTT